MVCWIFTAAALLSYTAPNMQQHPMLSFEDVDEGRIAFQHLEESSRIGIDATLITAEDASSLSKNLSPRKSTLVSLPQNLVDQIWTDRPVRTKNLIVHLEEKFSGESHESKLGRLRDELKKKECAAIILTALDEIAWLYNLRGSDIDFNPVFFAYAVVTMGNATLFVQGCAPADVNVKSYEEFWTFLKEFKSEGKVLVTDKSSLAVAEAVGKDNYTLLPSPVSSLKSIKNATELEGFRQCHIRDGAALVKYFSWLEDQLNEGKKLSEWGAAASWKSTERLFKGLSFPTISSTGANAAIIHYSPDSKESAIIDKEEVYLCDSGAQFFDGTTDHFGTPKPEEIRANTRVLQGHIAIDTAIFPNGTTGYIIDSWARRALWQDRLNYRHGTGHGVGHFLNVHEGPHDIGTRISLNTNALKPGMTVSNEPGYYADGKFGIRIENIVLVKEVQTPNNFSNKGYLGFEHVTMCPIHKKLVDKVLLTAEETEWFNDCHEEVW
ncbi:peptidase M24, structural domain-containing protein [Desarmillaria tabescens]|uniref:Peptidase M24, structural domain-containing protein n=1 Tax=Armillaria tabescens TaxID=1929756 RepID=A0AA39K008_ARMTA|nr:peptidase M24, structural domain-containing protein [Desarmillaria tabescens]KAK0452061.1 peptidase M24, structural domain-containing protein [Desarmillaria tabescens]